MNLQELQEAVARRVEAIPSLAGLRVIKENAGDVITQVEQAIGKTHFCVVVGSATFTDEAPDSSVCYGSTRIEISVFETPFINRKLQNRPTYLEACQAIAAELKLFSVDQTVLTSPSISSANDLGDGVISATVTFTAKTQL